MALAELLGQNIDESEFLEKFWDKRPLLIKGGSTDLPSLFTIEDIETCLTEADYRVPQFQMAANGKKFPKESYTRSRSWGSHHFNDLIDIPAVYRLWNEGATIILQSLHTNAKSLIPFLRSLESELRHPVQGNAYLTPRSSQGFIEHYDTHDVFAVQLDGRKRWKVWEVPVERIPLKDEHSPKGVPPEGGLYFDGILEQGDVLYIPRGYYHCAMTEDSFSLHLTVGILTLRRLDALKCVFDAILDEVRSSGEPEWREALPVRFDQNGDEKFDRLKDSIVERLLSKWSLKYVNTRFLEDAWPVNQHLLSLRDGLCDLNDETSLTLALFDEPSVQFRKSELVLCFGGRVMELPLSAKTAIQNILELRTFSPKDLVEYDESSRVTLCRHLVKEGLLRFSNPKTKG